VQNLANRGIAPSAFASATTRAGKHRDILLTNGQCCYAALLYEASLVNGALSISLGLRALYWVDKHNTQYRDQPISQ